MIWPPPNKATSGETLQKPLVLIAFVTVLAPIACFATFVSLLV
jgi:hypothetical protein